MLPENQFSEGRVPQYYYIAPKSIAEHKNSSK
jgi:hypothetical protein